MNVTEFQQRVTGTGKPVIVDFWAPWCAPCMRTKPILEKLGHEYADRIEFMPINADDSREVLRRFRVLGIPTVVTLRNGKEVGRATGAQNETYYRAMFEALSQGEEVKIPLTPSARMIRLGAGALLGVLGISTGSWLIAGAGGLIAFLGIYDRCPVWNALVAKLQPK